MKPMSHRVSQELQEHVSFIYCVKSQVSSRLIKDLPTLNFQSMVVMFKLLFFVGLLTISHAYIFDCLDDCECDTDDEVIHCHNGLRSQLVLPRGQRLRGFPVIGLTYNSIINLPDEDTLLSKFPDLKVIDVERNPDFNCSSVKNYDKVKIVSDCDRNVTDVGRVPNIFRPTRDCDMSCQLQRHYVKLHEYVLNLWEILKDKYNNFDYDQTMRQVKEFFNDMVTKVNNIKENVQRSMEDPPTSPRPFNEANEEIDV